MEKRNIVKLGSLLAGFGLVLTLLFIPTDVEANIWLFVGLVLVLFGVIAINIVEFGERMEPIDLMEAYAALTEEQKYFVMPQTWQNTKAKEEVKHGTPEPIKKTDI